MHNNSALVALVAVSMLAPMALGLAQNDTILDGAFDAELPGPSGPLAPSLPALPDAPPSGLGQLDPWIDANGDTMFGTLQMGANAILLGNAATISGQGATIILGPEVSMPNGANLNGVRVTTVGGILTVGDVPMCFQAGCVLTPGSVHTSHLAPGAVTANELALNSVSNSHLQNGAVDGLKVADLSLTNADFSDTAGIAWTKVSTTGSSLSDLATRSASALSSGVLPDGRLSGSYTQALSLLNAGNVFVGDGSGLTGVVASGLATGTYPNLYGFTNSGNTYEGSGASLSNLNAASLASGEVPDGRLAANVARIDGANIWTGVQNFGTNAALDGATITSGAVGAAYLPTATGGVAGIVPTTGLTNAMVASGAGIADTKLATISTAGKVSDSALSSNVARLASSQTFTGFPTFDQGAVFSGPTSFDSQVWFNERVDVAVGQLLVLNPAPAAPAGPSIPGALYVDGTAQALMVGIGDGFRPLASSDSEQTWMAAQTYEAETLFNGQVDVAAGQVLVLNPAPPPPAIMTERGTLYFDDNANHLLVGAWDDTATVVFRPLASHEAKQTWTAAQTYNAGTFRLQNRFINQEVPASATSFIMWLPAAEGDTLYGVTCTPTWSTTVWVEGKTLDSFKVRFGTSPGPGGRTVDCIVFR